MEIFVDEYAISPRRFIAGTKGSYGFCTLNFKFGSEWDGLAKKITFYPLDGSGAVYLIISDNEVKVPAEIMRCAGVNKYVISGCRDGDVLISVAGEIDVLNSLSPDGDPAQEPTPTQMEQVLDMMQRAVDTAQSVRDDADSGVFNGEKGEPGEVTLDYAHNNFANALICTVSGENVSITDLSPLEHKIDVRVRSKNLYSHGSTFTHTKNTAMSAEVSEGKTYTASAVLTADEGFLGRIRWKYTLDGSDFYTQDSIFINSGKSSSTLTVPSGATNVSVFFQVGVGTVERAWTNIQVEEGSVATDYVSHISDISRVRVSVSSDEGVDSYQPNDDGTVDSITSKSPKMTLSTDTEGAIIDCTYNRDINKAFEEIYNAIISLGGNV